MCRLDQSSLLSSSKTMARRRWRTRRTARRAAADGRDEGEGANRGEGQSAVGSGSTSLEPDTATDPGAGGYATVAPDKWARSVRYVVNTSLYGCQTVLQHLGLELALHGKKKTSGTDSSQRAEVWFLAINSFSCNNARLT